MPTAVRLPYLRFVVLWTGSFLPSGCSKSRSFPVTYNYSSCVPGSFWRQRSVLARRYRRLPACRDHRTCHHRYLLHLPAGSSADSQNGWHEKAEENTYWFTFRAMQPFITAVYRSRSTATYAGWFDYTTTKAGLVRCRLAGVNFTSCTACLYLVRGSTGMPLLYLLLRTLYHGFYLLRFPFRATVHYYYRLRFPLTHCGPDDLRLETFPHFCEHCLPLPATTATTFWFITYLVLRAATTQRSCDKLLQAFDLLDLPFAA